MSFLGKPPKYHISHVPTASLGYNLCSDVWLANTFGKVDCWANPRLCTGKTFRFGLNLLNTFIVIIINFFPPGLWHLPFIRVAFVDHYNQKYKRSAFLIPEREVNRINKKQWKWIRV